MQFNSEDEKASKAKIKEMFSALKNKQEIIKAGLMNRRDLLKVGLLSGAGYLVAKSGLGAWWGHGNAGSTEQVGVLPATPGPVRSLDHSKATATLRFTGLGLFDFNRTPGQCEVGIVVCRNHELFIDIQKESAAGATVVLSSQRLGHDLTIDAVNPAPGGAVPYTTDVIAFNRKADTGDPEDFRWITDLAGSEFHSSPLRLNWDVSASTPAEIGPKLTIRHGTFYTALRTDYNFARVTQTANGIALPLNSNPEFLGRIGCVIGADIECLDGAVVLRGADFPGGSLALKKEPGVHYTINIDNDCDSPVNVGDATDFLLYYNVLSAPGGAQFDLVRVIENAGNARGTTVIPNTTFSLDTRPQICTPSMVTIHS